MNRPARRSPNGSSLAEKSFSVNQVAEMMSVSPRWVYAQISSGALAPIFKFGYNLVRIPQSTMDAFLSRAKVRAATDHPA